jgi:spore maturation protein CgeB
MAFFGSSLVSSYWNGAATYYRGIIRALHRLGWEVTFFEPDAYERQSHRDIPDPDWATVVVYSGTDPREPLRLLESLRRFDVLVKASGVGVFDELLERELPRVRRGHQLCVFWDVDAPATIERLCSNRRDAFHDSVGAYDVVVTYGGGPPVMAAYTELGARRAVPIYNAVDPDTHHPVEPDPRFACDCALLVNRLPDREARIDEFFFTPAAALPHKTFLLGGSGWEGRRMPANVTRAGHVPTASHNAFNCTPHAVLSVNRASMARFGYSPATRIFEAAGAAACIVTDYWEGIDAFLEPETEILVARDGIEVVETLMRLDEETARRVGAAARRRVLAEHTYDRRARDVEATLGMVTTS